MTILRSYRDALVLVGGWVPYFLLETHRRPNNPFVHVGSIDIDLAVDPSKISETQYATIVELIQERGYSPAPDRLGDRIPYCFERTIKSPANNKPYKIRIDFLTHLHDPRQGKHRHLPVQDDLLARKIKGCEAAFQHNTTFDLEGELPEGGHIEIQMRMANIVGCLAMKGIVIGERYREKDAYDIYALMANYKNGPRDVAEEIRPCLSEFLVKDAVANIHTAFTTRDSHGPAWVAAFFPGASSEERERLITDAFMVVHEFDVLLFNPASNPRFPQPPAPRWDEKWIEKHRAEARAGLQKADMTGFMEVRFALSDLKPNHSQRELLEAARQAQIKTSGWSGWSIGLVFDLEEYRPRPRTDGIVAEIAIKEMLRYDYWALRNNGDFYLLKSLFEDEKEPGSIYFDTRIIRLTETLMYCKRLYSNLGVPDTTTVSIGIRHGGLKGRILRSANRGRHMSIDRSTNEDECPSEIHVPLVGLESDLVTHVKEFTKPLFMLFDFFELADGIYTEIIGNFVKGKVT